MSAESGMDDTKAATRGPAGDDVAANEAAPDFESRASDTHHESLRLWLRLLTCATMIERHVRANLRERFAISLPRFDLMAQLERHPEGLRMGELTRRLMVTGGNVTGITDRSRHERRRRPIDHTTASPTRSTGNASKTSHGAGPSRAPERPGLRSHAGAWERSKNQGVQAGWQ